MPDAEDPFARARWAMVEHQLRGRGIRDERVLQAMLAIPRERFVPNSQQPYAYEDRALPIGHGQTISQPYMVAFMLQWLAVEPSHKVLEVGAGSGYQAALLGQLAQEVYAVEIVPALAEAAAATIAGLGYNNVHIITGDGSVGYPPAAPYDRIIVAAAAPELPGPLLDQLVQGGRLVAPVGGRAFQECVAATRKNGGIITERGIGCTFVPLRGRHGWQHNAGRQGDQEW